MENQPPPSKKTKVSGDSSKETILEFLIKSNRPHSAQEILSSLEGKLGKTAIVNALEQLANDKKINEKVYGKQKVYMALQEVDMSDFKVKQRQMDETIIVSRGDLNRLSDENRRLESEIRTHEQVVPLSHLKLTVDELSAEVSALNEKLSKLREGNVKPITKEEKVKLAKENEKYAKDWRKLKRITNDMINAILDNSSMKKKQICEDLCLVMDEDENVMPPDLK